MTSHFCTKNYMQDINFRLSRYRQKYFFIFPWSEVHWIDGLLDTKAAPSIRIPRPRSGGNKRWAMDRFSSWSLRYKVGWLILVRILLCLGGVTLWGLHWSWEVQGGWLFDPVQQPAGPERSDDNSWFSKLRRRMY